MSDNVKDELADIMATQFMRSDGAWLDAAEQCIAHLAERGMVVRGWDGETLDVRPALRALAKAYEIPSRDLWVSWLAEHIDKPLAEAAVAAAEVEA